MAYMLTCNYLNVFFTALVYPFIYLNDLSTLVIIIIIYYRLISLTC